MSCATTPLLPSGIPAVKPTPTMGFKITSEMRGEPDAMALEQAGATPPSLGSHSRGTGIRVGRLSSTADIYYRQTARYNDTSSKPTPPTPPMFKLSPNSAPASPTLSASSQYTVLQDTPDLEWLTDDESQSPTWSTFLKGYAAGLWDPCKIPLQPYPSNITTIADSETLLSSPPSEVSNGPNLVQAGSTPWDKLQLIVPRVHPDPKSWFETHGYLIPPTPVGESARINALSRYSVLYHAGDVNFDHIVHLAKLVFQCQMAVVTLVDENLWAKSDPGTVPLYGERALSFCAHTVLQQSEEPHVILDTAKDWRYAKNPWVVGGGQFRFYAGAPIRTDDGHNIGTLCILDDKPRTQFSPKFRDALKDFSAIVMREIELWRDKIQLRIRDQIQKVIEKFTRDCLEMDLQLEDMEHAEERVQRVYRDAASLFKDTLDVDGALVLDISHFEVSDPASDRPYYHGNLFDGPPSHYTSSMSEPIIGFGPIPLLPVLGQDETSPRVDKPSMYSSHDHSQLSGFLSAHTDGVIFEREDLPSCFGLILPIKVRCVIIVPVFNVDKRPFLILCAYITRGTARTLETYELQFLRAVGVVILSAVLKRRTILADIAKSLFISNISHELRTPLHGILASAELLQDTTLVTEQSSYLKTVEGCAQSLVETVNHVLDFTKLAGSMRGKRKQVVSLESFDLNRLIDELVESCWTDAQARAMAASGLINSGHSTPQGLSIDERHPSFVEIVADVADRDQGWWVKSDKSGIRRILINLIGNSLKFTTNGFVHVRLRDLAPEADSNRLNIELSVFDSGKGISKDFLKNRIFQPFTQENPLETGTGLGLAVVNSIATGLGGKVDVWSAEGVGTEIRIAVQVEGTQEKRPIRPAVPLGHTFTVALVGFHYDLSHEGLRLLLETITDYLHGWFGFTIVHEDDANILLINDDVDAIRRFIEKRDFERPVVLLSTTRGAIGAVEEFHSNGGWCRTVFKPCGPMRLEEALRAAVSQLDSAKPAIADRRESGQRIFRNCAFDNEKDHASTSPSFISITEDGSAILQSAIETIISDHKLTVLLVDDNKVNRNLMGHWLTKRGFDFNEACDGQDAVEIFVSQPLGYFDGAPG